jgi:acyl-CoA synthetase (AMP-forming)/AMP-acid ligase II
MDAMLSAWRLTKNDTVLNVLPLHHVHGMINCVMSPLYAGGTVVMTNKFDAKQVLKIITCFYYWILFRPGIIYSMIVIHQLMSFQRYRRFI